MYFSDVEQVNSKLANLERRIFENESSRVLNYYDEEDIKDFEYDEVNKIFTFPCPCGDRFEISFDELLDGEVIATCPSCPLIIKVVYEDEDLENIRKMVGV